jgi:hypothetical protein
MDQPTLESLIRRIEALERAVGLRPTRQKDWRRVVGMFGDSEFSRQVDAEGQAIREAEREEARRAESAE